MSVSKFNRQWNEIDSAKGYVRESWLDEDARLRLYEGK